ncbi:hypothetical protein [Paenibacillus jamilae]|uniref:hypothetical protein n=1 Tax=Paenibacillus jamilae TaxID=114136 RepID=UPI000736D5A6|nr:hypothetical protein [Paenibacillus jamilae]
MSTIRVAKKKEFPYIQIDKFAIDEDSRISWQAKGLLTYLIGKPDDWIVRIGDLVKRASNGRDAVYSIINELIDAGYIEREQVRGDGSGKFGDISYLVYETPLHTNPLSKPDKRKKKKESAPLPENPDTVKSVDKSPLPENPDTGKPDTDRPDTGNQEHSNNDFSNNDFRKEKEEDSPSLAPSAFSAQWIKRDIERLMSKYPQYPKITETIGAIAIRDMRPVLAEEEFFLEQASAIPVHAETLWNIYQSVRPEIERTSNYSHIYELIESVFAKFGDHMKKGRINFDAVSWFKTTWFNERIALEQTAMLK